MPSVWHAMRCRHPICSFNDGFGKFRSSQRLHDQNSRQHVKSCNERFYSLEDHGTASKA